MATSQGNAFNTNPTALRIIATNERVTGPPAGEMLRKVLSKESPGSIEMLDNACGGGILTAEALKLADQISIQRIVASDIDEKMVAYTENRKAQSGWDNVEVKQLNQQAVDLPDNTFSHVFNNFGVFFSANDEATLSETYRITRSGGTAAFTSWKAIAWWAAFAQPALVAFIPEAPGLPNPIGGMPSKGWNDAEAIRPKLEKAGFQGIQISEYSFTPDVEPKAFAEACASLVKAITSKAWSAEDNQKYGDRIEPSILKYLHENFPNARWDGQMTALISVAKKP